MDGDEQRLHRTSVGDLECLVGVVPDGHQHGDVLRVEFALLELVVERGQQGGGGEMLRRERAQDAADQGGVERCGRGLSADVAEGYGDAAGAVVEEVVDVSADGAGGDRNCAANSARSSLGGLGGIRRSWTLRAISRSRSMRCSSS